MSESHRLSLSPAAATAALVAVLLAGAGGMYVVMRDGRSPSAGQAASHGPAGSLPMTSPATSASSTLPDVVVPLTKAAAERAGIELTHVVTQPLSDGLRVPGIVEPNAYRQVSVTPLVSGRVVAASVQLGDRVRKGQLLARVYSPEVAEARTKYVSAEAMLDAHDRELQRTQKLVEIGAASRQELERTHAEHAAQLAEVESARSRLQLLGVDPDGNGSSHSPKNATTNVESPIEGVVTERLANVGVNVDPSMKLFTIVDLSTVWIVADVYERDLDRVRQGARATVTTPAYPGRRLEGQVNFVNPQLDTTTRTAKIRVQVANPHGDLRLGMYTDVTLVSATASPVVSVPKDAIQNVGDRQFAYVASPDNPMNFIEREVLLGRGFSDRFEVLAGLSAGDSIVSKGSFFLRAEAERLGVRSAQSPMLSSAAGANAGSADTRAATITVTDKGFEPDRVKVRAGAFTRLTFLRTTDNTCGTELVFPSLNIKRALPLREPVPIEFTPPKTGELVFACGENMLKGIVVIQ